MFNPQSGLSVRWSEEFLVTWQLWSLTWQKAASPPLRSHSYSPSHRSRPPPPCWSLLLWGENIKWKGVLFIFFRFRLSFPWRHPLIICCCWSCSEEHPPLRGSDHNIAQGFSTGTKLSVLLKHRIYSKRNRNNGSMHLQHKCVSSSIMSWIQSCQGWEWWVKEWWTSKPVCIGKLAHWFLCQLADFNTSYDSWNSAHPPLPVH